VQEQLGQGAGDELCSRCFIIIFQCIKGTPKARLLHNLMHNYYTVVQGERAHGSHQPIDMVREELIE
jgi:hypothetical protein